MADHHTVTPSGRSPAVTVSGGTVHTHEKGERHARIPQPVFTVVVIGADSGALWCRLSARPHDGVFVLAFAPWPVTTVLTCPPTAWPARERLSVRNAWVITRIGRTARYLVPAFAPN
jgi:hypothetical protein